MPRFRLILSAVFLALVAGALLWISRLPSRLDCLERGGQADSLYRYCIGPAGTDRLREDVMFRFYEALPVLVVVFIVAGLVHHHLRTRRKNATPPG
jgi:hypothetical protein